jgi:TatD DNase family protein
VTVSVLRLTDSHCHLAMADADEAAAALERARTAGVVGVVVPGTHLSDAPAAVAVAQRHEGVWAAVGFHPHEAKDCSDDAFAQIAALARRPKVVAIGEIGLDYHYDHSPRKTQQEVLVRHMELARELDLPVIIHNRESTADLLAILESDDARGTRGILHSFTESADVALRLIGLGYFISFSGIITFRSADTLREAARRLPPERVLIETDTPYLAPVPFRGRPNEPAFVARVAEQLAAIWSLPLEDVAERTTANFEIAFGVKIPG